MSSDNTSSSENESKTEDRKRRHEEEMKEVADRSRANCEAVGLKVHQEWEPHAASQDFIPVDQDVMSHRIAKELNPYQEAPPKKLHRSRRSSRARTKVIMMTEDKRYRVEFHPSSKLPWNYRFRKCLDTPDDKEDSRLTNADSVTSSGTKRSRTEGETEK